MSVLILLPHRIFVVSAKRFSYQNSVVFSPIFLLSSELHVQHVFDVITLTLLSEMCSLNYEIPFR
jgi:hypothetical protein